MSNRHQRRAASHIVRVPDVLPSPPDCPNISGTDECCANCRFSADPKIASAIVNKIAEFELKMGRPAPQQLPIDDVWCNALPDNRAKKTWGWCGMWRAKT